MNCSYETTSPRTEPIPRAMLSSELKINMRGFFDSSPQKKKLISVRLVRFGFFIFNCPTAKNPRARDKPTSGSVLRSLGKGDVSVGGVGDVGHYLRPRGGDGGRGPWGSLHAYNTSLLSRKIIT